MEKLILIEFLDSIRAYERESRNMIGFDERESEEFVDIFLSEREQAKPQQPTEQLQQADVSGRVCYSSDCIFNNKNTNICTGNHYICNSKQTHR